MDERKQLEEKRATIGAEIKRFAEKANDKSQTWTDEDQANYEKCNADYDGTLDALKKLDEADARRAEIGKKAEQVEQYQAHLEAERRKIGRNDFSGNAQPVVTNEQRGLALRGWFNADKRGITGEEAEACRALGIDPRAQYFDFDLCTTDQVNEGRAQFIQKRALSAHIGASGAFTIADGFVNSLESAMLAFGGMRQVAEIIRTDGGNNILYPTSNDTSNTGELIAESTAVSEQDVSFGAVTIGAHKYSSKLVKVPAELMEDSAFNIPTMLGALLGERIGRITNTHFTTGDGAARPRGITTMTTLGKTAAGATSITMDEILDLIYSVEESYLPGASFMLKRSTTQLLRKLKDGEGRYLWQQGVGGAPDTLWSFPYTENTDMPAATSGLKSVVFGQLNKYKIREVRSVRLKRLVERYAEYDQEGFVAFARYDGVLVDAGTNPVKHLIQA